MPNEGACCAHCKVEVRHTDYPSGGRSDYWECTDCKQRFTPLLGIHLDANIAKLALLLIQKDPHQWSTRGCVTCETMSRLLGQSFGCVLFAEQQKKGGR